LVRIVKQVLSRSGQLDKVFQALADPSRRVIVEQLVIGPAPVKAIAAPLAMSLPAVLQHVQVLEECGLIRSEKVGRVRTCYIEPNGLRMAEGWVTHQRTEWETRLDQLGEFLRQKGDQR
jgi:DNA-binding transcriptional ArsR family regulator